MNIRSDFLHSLVSRPRLSPGQKPEDFLGQIFLPSDTENTPLLKLLSYGNTKAVSPWSFDIGSLDCHLLLYTRNGCGKLTVGSQVYTLDESSLLFFDCRQRFRFDIAISPWEYQILFFRGDSLSYFSSLLPKEQLPILQAPSCSDFILNLDLLAAQIRYSGIRSQLMISDLLNRIVTEYITESLVTDSPALQVPAHIREMKKMFDENFQNLYTLNYLEEYFGISKYRLCREFSGAYEIPPLQYLNRKRIDHAAGLLITTNALVHEIGSMVGIDNTNHFISLFKKFRGVTPLEYRQRMTC